MASRIKAVAIGKNESALANVFMGVAAWLVLDGGIENTSQNMVVH